MLPPQELNGLLASLHGDIRQDAAQELLSRFISGNTVLQVAAKCRDLPVIGVELWKSIVTCLACNRKRRRHEELRHKGAKEHSLQSPYHPLPCGSAETNSHDREHLMRTRMSELLLSPTAAEELASEDIELLRILLIDELTRKQVAIALIRSESWISKRLTRLKIRLSGSKSVREFLEMDM